MFLDHHEVCVSAKCPSTLWVCGRSVLKLQLMFVRGWIEVTCCSGKPLCARRVVRTNLKRRRVPRNRKRRRRILQDNDEEDDTTTGGRISTMQKYLRCAFLFFSSLTCGAVEARVNHASNANVVSYFDLSYFGTDCSADP